MKKKNMRYVYLLLCALLLALCVPYTGFANDAGYLFSAYVSTDDGYLNMRSEPTTSSGVICEIPDCVRIEIYSVDGDWGYGSCYLDGSYEGGWVYIPGTEATYEQARDRAGKATDMDVVVQSGDGFLNMRHEPTTLLNNVMLKIPTGTELVVTRKTDKNWGLVHYNGQTGWISLKETGAPVEEEPSETPALTETDDPLPLPSGEDKTEAEKSKKGSVSLEGDKILGDNALILILIGIAIFLIVVVAVLMIVIINRSKEKPATYVPRSRYDDYDGYDNYDDRSGYGNANYGGNQNSNNQYGSNYRNNQ